MPRSKKGAPPAYRFHSFGQARVTVRDRHGNRRDIMRCFLGVQTSELERRLASIPIDPFTRAGKPRNDLLLRFESLSRRLNESRGSL